jgi:proton glutamate symport protein
MVWLARFKRHGEGRVVRLSFAMLFGLLGGLALGLFLDPAVPGPLFDTLDLIGQTWVNGLRLTVIPLVVSCLVVSVGSSHDAAMLGRIGRRAAVLFVLLLTAASLFSYTFAAPLLSRLSIDPAVATTLRERASDAAAETAETIGVTSWLHDLVPENPVRAAADGSMLSLIVLALLLGLAIRRAGDEPRQAVLGFFQGLAEAMFVLVRWVLALAPVGVFALAVPLAANMGTAIANVLTYYVALVVTLTVLFSVLVLYPLVTLGGRVPLGRFARGVLPAQIVAFSSRSSLASLPVMIEGVRTTLGLGEEVTVFLVPLAGSLFRIGSAIAQMVGVLFLARLYGVEIADAQIVTVIATVVLTTLSVPGVPGGSILAIGPVLLAAGVPLSGIGVLLAVDLVPDLFRTTANVTGGMAAAAVIGKRIPTVLAWTAHEDTPRATDPRRP